MTTGHKKSVYKTIVRRILLYVAERKGTKPKINNVEIKVLRSIKAITQRDRQTNSTI